MDIQRLSVPERLELIERLCESLPDTPDALPLPESHREELERRLAAADAAPDVGIPWEEVRERLDRQP